MPKGAASARHRRRRRLGRRAPQRRGRARRDLSGDGQQRDDVRRARLCGGSSAAGGGAPVARQAAGDPRARGLLPAVRVADLGHRPDLPRAARDRRRTRAGAGARGARLAQADAGARREGRLGGAPAERAARRLGVPVCQPALPRRRRHRRGGDGDGSRAGRKPGSDFAAVDRARQGMDLRRAEQERRLGRVRRRQRVRAISTTSHSPITARCSIRRPRT